MLENIFYEKRVHRGNPFTKKGEEGIYVGLFCTVIPVSGCVFLEQLFVA